jgi:hypothetical protein|tara:strand:- start:421 stop:729 length:309 start_codon:yes stop_codon:yes gene_type:complete
MAGLINASLNLTEIPKDRIVKGKKGQYINVTIAVNDDPDQFDQHCSITVQQTKEEREAKEKKLYLGNGKVVWSNGVFPDKPAFVEKTPIAPEAKVQNDDLPF